VVVRLCGEHLIVRRSHQHEGRIAPGALQFGDRSIPECVLHGAMTRPDGFCLATGAAAAAFSMPLSSQSRRYLFGDVKIPELCR
jgi:hypothetical protein